MTGPVGGGCSGAKGKAIGGGDSTGYDSGGKEARGKDSGGEAAWDSGE